MNFFKFHKQISLSYVIQKYDKISSTFLKPPCSFLMHLKFVCLMEEPPFCSNFTLGMKLSIASILYDGNSTFYIPSYLLEVYICMYLFFFSVFFIYSKKKKAHCTAFILYHIYENEASLKSPTLMFCSPLSS